jgi:hypothetical protein
MLIADAQAHIEATAFAIGNGSTQPKGVITAVPEDCRQNVATATSASAHLAHNARTERRNEY